MKFLHHLILTALFATLLPGQEAAPDAKPEQEEASSVRYDIDWPQFLKKRNMVWKKAPSSWDNAPFLGNGRIGMQVMKDGNGRNGLRIEVACMDAQEHVPYDEKSNIHAWAYSRYRVPIGYFAVTTASGIRDYDLELDLWDAELKGTITTDKGAIAIRAFAHATTNLLVVELYPGNGEGKPTLEWHAYENASPRTTSWGADTGKKEAPNAKPGKPGRLTSKPPEVSVWEQPLRPSGLVSTAWQVIDMEGDGVILHASIEHSFPKNTASETAADLVKKAGEVPSALLYSTHQEWWHAYYPGAFLSLPDGYWDSFYWAQVYKIGSGMREDGPVLDLQGPWTGLPRNAWPGVWWNLNVQLTYWPCYTGNRLREAMSLPNNLRRYRENLVLNVDEPYRKDSAGIPRSSGHDIRNRTGVPGATGGGSSAEVGSLPWACHNLFLHYRMTMDDGFLREDVYPLLRRAINYYIHFLEKGDDGKLHLPPTLSPEYGTAPDCNYDLALLRWGCETLLWSAERLKINDPLVPRWKEILRDLTDYPVDDNGYMVGRGVPFKNSHRHYSHLFMVYPLHLVDTADPRIADLTDRSVRHWHSLKQGLQGYSFSGGASLYATLKRGNDAYEMLEGLKRYIRPNTLYRESWPVMETPLSGAAAIHDMILQSWNGEVDVFAAIPDEWADVVFHDLRAQGAFLVSAERKDGKTQWIRVKSLAGEPLTLVTHMNDDAVINGSGAASLERKKGASWQGTMPKGSEIIVKMPGVKPVVSEVPISNAKKSFGME